MQVRGGQSGGGSKDIIKLDGIGQVEQAKNPQGKAKVTHTVDHKGLDSRRIGRGFTVIEPDQKVRGYAHTLPAEEHLYQIVRGDQRQHGKGKERQIGKEPCAVGFVMPPVFVMRHIAKAIQVHHSRHRVDHNQHDRRQPIQPDAPIGRKGTAFNPAQQGNMLCNAIKGQKHIPRQARRQKEQSGRDNLPRSFANQAPKEPTD